MKTDDELKFLDELEAIESNTLHLVVGGALGARQMHLTPHHGRKSVCHSVSFHYTISFLVSHFALFGSSQTLMKASQLGSCQRLRIELLESFVA